MFRKYQMTLSVYNLDEDDQSGTFQFAIRHQQWKLIMGQTEERQMLTKLGQIIRKQIYAENPKFSSNDVVI